MISITVVCAIPDGSFRSNLFNLLAVQPDVRCVEAPALGGDALELVRSGRYDVALVDSSLRFDGEALMDWMLALAHRTRVILYQTTFAPMLLSRALQQGACGVVGPAVPAELCLKAIRAVHAGDMWFARSVLVSSIRSMRLPAVRLALDAPSDEALTVRECDIYSKAVLGMTNKEIGRDLHIGETTVKTHLKHIFTKLGVYRRSQLYIHASSLTARHLKPVPGNNEAREEGRKLDRQGREGS